MGNLIHSIRVLIEHQVKSLGLYTGIAFVLVIFPLLLWIDSKIHATLSIIQPEVFGQIVAINNVLAGLLFSILLTTFSVVFVVMQLASSQFSPRILRYFLYSDVRIQQFIGLFLGAISLIFLSQIYLVFSPEILPKLTVFVSLGINLYCILISFPRVIAHLSDNMNVATITNRVKNEVIHEIEFIYPDSWVAGNPMVFKRPQTNPDRFQTEVFWTGNSGYLSEVNYGSLKQARNRLEHRFKDLPPVRVFQKVMVGEFIMKHTTCILVLEWEKPISPELIRATADFWAECLIEIYYVNKFRSYTQDINFGVRKLVDIAMKAISPAVNDPTTCLNCLDYLGEIIRTVQTKQFPSASSRALVSNHIFVNEFNFDELVDFCFGQIFHWGKSDPVVVKRLLLTIRQLLPFVENPTTWLF